MENFAYSKMEHPFQWIFSKHWNWKFLCYYFKICRGPDRTSKRAASGPRAVVCSSLPYFMTDLSKLPVLNFSQWCCWRFKCLWIRRCALERVLAEVSKGDNAFNFRVKQFKRPVYCARIKTNIPPPKRFLRLRIFEDKGIIIFRKDGNFSQNTQCHVSEDLDVHCTAVFRLTRDITRNDF